MKHICIYCKKEKEESEFNREHVVPQMYGRYQDGFVLNSNQVCRECNSYFSTNLENVVGLDSIEALDRMQFGTRKMRDGRKLNGNRMKIVFTETALKGVVVRPTADSTRPERIRFQYGPLIGILREDGEYDYYVPDQVPVATEAEKDRLGGKKRPILAIGISEEESTAVLKERGWVSESSGYAAIQPQEILGTEDVLFSIKDVDDPIKRRLAAKTVLNYLCYRYGKDYALREEFDPIREYVRYGTWNPDKLFFLFKTEPLSFCDLPNERSHAVGFAYDITDDVNYFIGIVTWFGKLTYEIRLYEDKDAVVKYNIGGQKMIAANKKLEDTWMLYCDNDKRVQSEENSIFIVNHMSIDVQARKK